MNRNGPKNCTWSDIAARFTECDAVSGTKSLVYYYLPPVTCQGGVKLPDTVHDVPCDLQCHDGEVFDETIGNCTGCRAGTFRNGNWRHFPDFRGEVWPSQFETYCWQKDGDECNTWQMRGDYVDSGDNLNHHNSESILAYHVEVGDNAKVSFEYQVFGENFWTSMYDYFEVMMVTGRGPSVTLLKKAEQYQWSTFEHDLEPGFIELIFKYKKDSSMSKSHDRAKLRNIQIHGVVSQAPRCEKCPPGFFSEESFSACLPCPANTYAPEEGSTECLPCPQYQKSFGGASECISGSYPCTEEDYYSSTSETCDGDSRTRSYHWIKPQLCNTTLNESVPLPDDEQIPCYTPGRCHPGEQVKDNSCEICPDGKHSTSGLECTNCPLGQAPSNPTRYITRFEPDSSLFTTGCDGQCQSSGWRFMSDRMDSGKGNGVSTSWVETEFENVPSEEVTISVDYTLSCKNGHGEIEFYINGMLSEVAYCRECHNATDTETAVFSMDATKESSTNKLKIQYRTFTAAGQKECDEAVVHKIALAGVTDGGATHCETCVAGTFLSENKCQNCPAGSMSEGETTECKACPENTFAKEGSGECHPCGEGMTSRMGSSSCRWKEKPGHFKTKVSDMNREYDLSHLAVDLSKKPITSGSWSYYINLEAQSRKKVTTGDSPCGEGVFVCRTNEQGQVEDLGNSPSFSAEVGTITMHATNYEARCNVSQANSDQAIRSDVIMSCSLSTITPTISVIQTDVCHYVFRVDSREACPMCSSADFYSTTGECVGGVRPILYHSLGGEEHQCYQGYTPTHNETTTKGCDRVEISPSQWWIAVIVFLALISVALILIVMSVLLAVCAYRFYSKFKTVETEKKQLLESRQNNVEMPDAMDEVSNEKENEGEDRV